MAITIVGTITGGAQTGFTTPAYITVADNAPDLRSSQAAVTSLTGTQVGVTTHSVNAPFTITKKRPSVLKTIYNAFLNGVTGQYSRIPFNDYTIIVRKAAQVALNQWVINEYRFTAHIGAGTETYDPANVRAGVSCAVGTINTNSAGIGDTVISGIA